MKRILLFFILLGIIIGILNGVKVQNQTENYEENILIESTENITELTLPISDIDTLNPIKTRKIHLSNILKLIYDPLFSYDEENQVTPVLAEKWMKRDEFTWIIRLRENVEWHNGNVFTANDVKYTIDNLIMNEIGSVYNANVRNISNVDVMDEKTIAITLIESDPYFISKLVFPIIPYDSIVTNVVIGTGPYKYAYEDEEALKLIANDNWWKNENIKLKKINLRKYATYNEAIKGFKSSEIDMIITNMYDWKENFGFIGINSYQYDNTEYEVLIPNTEDEILKDSSVRKAILYAINRENIISEIYDENAELADIPIMSNSKYTEMAVEYNPEVAKQVLMNGSWNYNGELWEKEGTKLKLTIHVQDDDYEKKSVAEKVKNDLNDIGIRVSIKEVDWETLKTLLETNKFELILMSLDIKNEYQIQELVKIGSEYNLANFINIPLNNVIAELENLTGEAYDDKMKEFKEMYINELPYIGLYFKKYTILTNKSVKGEYKSTYYEPYRNIINFYK